MNYQKKNSVSFAFAHFYRYYLNESFVHSIFTQSVGLNWLYQTKLQANINQMKITTDPNRDTKSKIRNAEFALCNQDVVGLVFYFALPLRIRFISFFDFIPIFGFGFAQWSSIWNWEMDWMNRNCALNSKFCRLILSFTPDLTSLLLECNKWIAWVIQKHSFFYEQVSIF